MHIKARITSNEAAMELDGCTTIRVDTEGRWCSFHEGQRHFRRTVDARVVAYRRFDARVLNQTEADGIHEDIRRRLKAVKRQIDEKNATLILSRPASKKDTLVACLRRAEKWTATEFSRERLRFDDAYVEEVTILPPDRYRDVVIQPAKGCPHNRCTFCAFYRGQTFSPLSPQAFSDHLTRVKTLFGRALGGRDGIFLGSASAASLSQSRLFEVLRQIHDRLGSPKRGIASFYDPDHAPKRNKADFVALRNAGLRQLIIGLETGSGILREKLGKSSRVEELLKHVAALKEAGMQLGLSVLLGVDTHEMVDEHRDATIAWLGEAPLTQTDLVYLSPLRTRLSEMQAKREVKLFRAALKNRTKAHILPYHMDGFFYYA